jgi:DnaJ-class molecular chaperone
MIPTTNKEKDKIICFDCDGTGIEVPLITTDNPSSPSDISQPCDTCKGSGYLPIIKTK